MNLITAVIVEHAFNSAKEDEEMMAHEIKMEQEAEIAELGEIFKEIDDSGDGKLSKDEFVHAVKHNSKIKSKIEMLEMTPQDLIDLWELFCGGEEELSGEGFERGMHAVRGDAKAK